jgi:uncharacterized integral membrane protein
MKDADPIESLPTDKDNVSANSLHLLNTFFTEKESHVRVMLGELREVVILAILYILISLPQVDSFLLNIFSFTNNSPIILMVVKGVVLGILYYVTTNFKLIKS